MTRLAVLAGVLAALATGCGGSNDRPDVDLNDVRLAAVIKGLDNPFFITLRDGLVAGAEQQGARLQVAAAPAGLQDTAGQATALETLAADDPACYVVNPINPTNLVRALARVPDDTPIVNVDSLIAREPAKAVGVDVTTYIGTDNVAAGRLGADAMAGLVRQGAHVAVIEGIPGDIGSGLRSRGFREGAGGRFDVVERAAADFERGKARLAAQSILEEDPDIAGFFAVNDLMALGVADAMRKAGRGGDVAVIGMDGIEQALAAIERGRMSATVAQYPFTMGQLGIEACMAALRGRDVPAKLDAPVQVVDRANVARARQNFPRPVEPFEDPFRASDTP